jgi:transcriptional regulator with XRE-family HTH domain
VYPNAVTRLKALRIKHNLSQTEVAARAGVSQTIVSACERGMSSPALLERIASVFNIEEPKTLLDRVLLDHTPPEE